MHNISNSEVDGLQQQKITSGSIPVGQDQEFEAIIGTDSTKLASWKVGGGSGDFFFVVIFICPVASDSCSCLSGVELSVVSCSCGPSTSNLDVLCMLRCTTVLKSDYWILFCSSNQYWTFSSDLSNQQFLFSAPFFVKEIAVCDSCVFGDAAKIARYIFTVLLYVLRCYYLCFNIPNREVWKRSTDSLFMHILCLHTA